MLEQYISGFRSLAEEKWYHAERRAIRQLNTVLDQATTERALRAANYKRYIEVVLERGSDDWWFTVGCAEELYKNHKCDVERQVALEERIRNLDKSKTVKS